MHVKNMPAYVCANCGKGTKTLYLITKSHRIGKWTWKEVMTGVCKDCFNKKP